MIIYGRSGKIEAPSEYVLRSECLAYLKLLGAVLYVNSAGSFYIQTPESLCYEGKWRKPESIVFFDEAVWKQQEAWGAVPTAELKKAVDAWAKKHQ